MTSPFDNASCEAMFLDVEAHVIDNAWAARSVAERCLVLLNTDHAETFSGRRDRFLIHERVEPRLGLPGARGAANGPLAHPFAAPVGAGP